MEINCKLKDICKNEKGSIISGPFGSNIGKKYFVPSGIPVIRGNNLSLSSDKFYDDGFVFVTPEKANKLNCFATRRDLVFTAAGTIGQVGIIPDDSKYQMYVISNKQLRARIDENKVDILYAYYWFSSPWIQKTLIANNKGSTVPLITLNEVKELPITFPESLQEQRVIGQTIDLLSKKIELNNQIISELEEISKTIYNYWFVQFDFPTAEGKPYRSSGGEMVWNERLKREIPKGWEVSPLPKHCDVIDCLHSAKPPGEFEAEQYFLLQLENLVDHGLVDLTNKYYVSKEMYDLWTSRIEVNEGDLVITNAGRVGSVARIPANLKAGIGRNMTAIRPRDIPALFLYYFITSSDVAVQIKKNTDSGSFFGSLNVRGIKELCFTLPSDNTQDILGEFAKLVSPYRARIELCAEENSQLANLREWLLPMLMNGQVSVR
jgi:type I restriction enzyme, S subunit